MEKSLPTYIDFFRYKKKLGIMNSSAHPITTRGDPPLGCQVSASASREAQHKPDLFALIGGGPRISYCVCRIMNHNPINKSMILYDWPTDCMYVSLWPFLPYASPSLVFDWTIEKKKKKTLLYLCNICIRLSFIHPISKFFLAFVDLLILVIFGINYTIVPYILAYIVLYISIFLFS